MPKHPKKKSKKKPGQSVHARAIKRTIDTQKVNAAGRAAAGRQTRLDRGQDIAKDFSPRNPIHREPSPGIKARAKNLRLHGEQVPVRTQGKIDTGGPVQRMKVRFQKFVNTSTARSTAKVLAARKKRKKKS